MSAEQIQNLRLNGHVERGRRLVGKQNFRVARQARWPGRPAGACRRKNGGDRAFMPLHAAWSIPTRRHELQHARAQSRRRDICGSCTTDSFGDLRADGHAGVQRGHRVLKDHGKQDVRAASAARVPRYGAMSAPFTRILPVSARAFRQQAHDGACSSALLPQPDSPTTASTSPESQRKADVPHRLHGLRAGCGS